jgi:hypothetical protein
VDEAWEQFENTEEGECPPLKGIRRGPELTENIKCVLQRIAGFVEP